MGQEGSALNIPPRKVVKTLAVGQEVEGVVKRVTEFGAFIDIGVGRDGLVHVSEMAQGRVSKPSDVVNEGDKVRVWIKELDREKNRISLSMIEPGTMTLRDLEEGSTVRGKVTRLERYGAFVDIGVGRDGMLHVKEMGRGYVEKPEDVVHIGDEIDVQVIGLDRRRGRIDLSIKELLPPAPEAASRGSSCLRRYASGRGSARGARGAVPLALRGRVPAGPGRSRLTTPPGSQEEGPHVGI